MTVTQSETDALSSGLAVLWQRHYETNLERITLLEDATANVLRGVATADEVDEAAGAAHKLAGSLGTFGFDAGSKLALEAENLLRSREIPERRLAEAVAGLRSTIAERQSDADPKADSPATPGTTAGDKVLVVTSDGDLTSRLATAGAAVGIGVATAATMPSTIAEDTMAVLIDGDDDEAAVLATTVAELANRAGGVPIVAVTEHDGFDDRLTLTRVGARAVISRANAARLAVAYLAEMRVRRTTQRTEIVVLDSGLVLADRIRSAIGVGPGHGDHGDDDDAGGRVTVCSSEAELFDAVSSGQPDLVVIDGRREPITAAEIARTIRSNPLWSQLPLVAYGPRRTAWVQEALAAGIDDYLSSQVSVPELGCRLRTLIDRSRLASVRSDRDAHTGAQTREAAERSIEAMVRRAGEGQKSVAFCRVTVDGLDSISEKEGAVVGDVLLQHLGARLVDSFRGQDIVGRWTERELVVALDDVDQATAADRLTAVLEAIRTENVTTTSGQVIDYRLRAGISSFPIDGTTLGSLARASETALEQAVDRGADLASAADPGDGLQGPNVDVVIVEDDDSIADVVEHALGLRGYSSHRFSDGAAAASALTNGEVKGKIVLLDVGLPSLDGFGVLRLLRTNGVLTDSHVIMLTARSNESEMLRALGLGATEHVTKPFSVPMLLGRLAQLLGSER